MTPEYIIRKSACRPPHCDSSTPERLADRQESELENMNWSREYAERGYTQPSKGILFANWNVFSKDLDGLLERYGYSVEWSDEWSTCADCGKAVRTSEDSYQWQPYYVMMQDCELICLDCVNWADYLESIEDKASKAVFSACNPAEYGYELVSQPHEYENGFHVGQNDKPADILKRLHAQGKRGIVFRIPETSQFYITFETWQRIVEVEEEDTHAST